MGYFENEPTRSALLDYLDETEIVFGETLAKIDPNSSVQLISSLDLGFPHDVVRIASGFPTGSLITWNANVPFVPVDTTVNVCTSSVFELSNNVSNQITEDIFNSFFAKIERSSYMSSFHRGNHFISFMENSKTNKQYLVLHSSASEFKKTYNGLFPVKNNWYYDDIRVETFPHRQIRYLIGNKAQLFIEIAHQIEDFNIVRHNFFAESLYSQFGKIDSCFHKHHYYMPTDQSVMIGGFLVNGGDQVPFFTYPGDPILIFEFAESSASQIKIGNRISHIMPHGWGKYSIVTPKITVDLERNIFILNDHEFQIDSSSSLRDHPDLRLRRFNLNKDEENYYFNLVGSYFKGKVVDKLDQIISWNKHGLIRWK